MKGLSFLIVWFVAFVCTTALPNALQVSDLEARSSDKCYKYTSCVSSLKSHKATSFCKAFVKAYPKNHKAHKPSWLKHSSKDVYAACKCFVGTQPPKSTKKPCATSTSKTSLSSTIATSTTTSAVPSQTCGTFTCALADNLGNPIQSATTENGVLTCVFSYSGDTTICPYNACTGVSTTSNIGCPNAVPAD